MKKLSLLLATLGGAAAGYVMSDKKLRDELADADTTEDAARILGKHLQRDGKKLAGQMQEFVQSDEVQQHFSKAKKITKAKVDEATDALKSMANDGSSRALKSAKTAAKRGAAKAKKTAAKGKTTAKRKVKKATNSAKKSVKRTTKKAKTTAKKTANRLKTKTRKVS